METLTRKLLNDFQRNFPLTSCPYQRIAEMLNTSSDVVLSRLRELKQQGAVSRVGPVFKPNTVGVSTLATMAVPSARLEKIAQIVNQFAQVNHNYEREHRFNLWFVVTANDKPTLDQTLEDIQRKTGYEVLSLPLLREYHIDLGFRMHLDNDEQINTIDQPDTDLTLDTDTRLASSEDLIEVIQQGLPLVARPYQQIADQLGWSEDVVIAKLKTMIDAGIIKRLGIVVRHHELGYRANAMVVWDVPDAQIDHLGVQLGTQDCVTLCYQRPRKLPDWPYNLFCMVHGRDRDEVLQCIENLTERLGLNNMPHTVLFSGKRFRQRGARYRLGHRITAH